jgi:hypothetical protein
MVILQVPQGHILARFKHFKDWKEPDKTSTTELMRREAFRALHVAVGTGNRTNKWFLYKRQGEAGETCDATAEYSLRVLQKKKKK